MTSGRFRGSTAVWLALLAYASLYPFAPLHATSAEAVAGAFSRPHHLANFDFAANVLAYIPLGILACLHFRQSGARHPALKAIVAGTAFSMAMEGLQLFIPGRISSAYDTLANSVGTALGTLAFADPLYSLVSLPLARRREALVIGGAWGDAGLMLLVLWMIAQLNPALPFFGAGNIVFSDLDTRDLAILQAASVAMGIWGFGLFVSTLLARESGALRATLVLLSTALWLKFVAASVMLQPHFAEEWLSLARVAGLVAGVALLVPSRRFPRMGRIYLALVLVLAGALVSKIAGAYSGLDELLRVFRWPYGQLANFTTLTRFLHELWPLLAVAFLIALFFHARRTVESKP
ncbi:MAG TPA: VanZ family protein [Usitatibacter sp.]|nr:VanZ family protein [Usitatibacter sp.]